MDRLKIDTASQFINLRIMKEGRVIREKLIMENHINRDFRNCDFQNVDFSKITRKTVLEIDRFRDSETSDYYKDFNDFFPVNKKASLNFINFSRSTFENCIFKNSLLDCNFYQTKIINCDFDGSKLVICKFDQATITNCNFKIKNTNFKVAPLSAPSFNQTKITNCNFDGSGLKFCNFEQATLIDCNFNNAKLDEKKFVNAKICAKTLVTMNF